MSSTYRVDSSTLGWVKSEIDQTLDQAREALESYSEAGDDLMPLRSFNNSVHQVAGTLQMVELDGASQLAQEIESLASAVIAGRVEGTDGSGLLGKGLDYLSAYMTRLAEGAPDQPVANVDVINELRRARHAEELDVYALFRPELGVYPTRQEPPEDLEGDDYYQRVRQLRQRFQGALLRWLRNQDDEEAWQGLADVVDELYRLSRFQVSMQIWWVARAYLDVLKAADLKRDDPRKHPLAKLDLLIRTLTEENEAAIAREGSDKLVRYMLYHIGTSEAGTEAVQDVIRLFELDTVLGTQPPGAPLPDSATLEAMRGRVAGSLRAVQTALEGCARAGQAGDDFTASDGHLRQIADTARELGIDELARVSDGVRHSLFINGEPNHSGDVLEAAAGALLFIEHTLEAQSVNEEWRREAAALTERLAGRESASEAPSLAIDSHEIDTESLDKQELRRLVAAVAGQVEENLKEAEQNLEHFARDASDTDSMKAVVESLQQVHGAVRMLGQHKLCDLLETAIARIRELISGDGFPSDPVLDALAVTIGTTDAYVQGLERDAPNLDVLLNRAARELEAASTSDKPLSIDPASALQRITRDFETWIGDNSEYQAFNSLRRNLRDIGALAHQQGRLNLQGIAQEMINLLDIVMDDPAALTHEVEGTLRRSLSALTELGESLAPPAGLVETSEAPAVEPGSASNEVESEGDEVVREAFAEEAQECLAAIDGYLETLGKNADDAAALADMRRGFHTIKGSGRMVGARDIGELAWVVEDVLNRSMASEESIRESTLDFVSQARRELGELLERGLDSNTDLMSWRSRAASLQSSSARSAEREHTAATRVAAEAGAEDGPEDAATGGVPAQGDEQAAANDDARDAASTTVAGHLPDTAPGAAEGDEADAAGEAEPVLQSIGDLGEQGHKLAGGQVDAETASPFSDDEVIRIFSKEALSHIGAIRAVVDECRRNGPAVVGQDMLRAVHTLQGNARSLHLVEMSEAYTVLDNVLEAASDGTSKKVEINEVEADVLDDLLVATAKVLDHLNRGKRFPELVRQELIEIAGRIDAAWRGGVEKPGGGNPLEGLEFASEFARGQAGDGGQQTDAAPTSSEGGTAAVRAFHELTDSDPTVPDRPADSAAEVDAAGELREDEDGAPVDNDLKEVFVEEAMDTLSRIESALQHARRSGLSTDTTNTLKRELHTLKGSSRAAGVESVGDLSHDAETTLEQVASTAEAPSDLLETLEEVHDTLASMVQGLGDKRGPQPDAGLVRRLRGVTSPVRDEEPGHGRPRMSPSLIPEEDFPEPPGSAVPQPDVPKPDAPKAQAETTVATGRPETTGPGNEDAATRTDGGRPTVGRSTVRIQSNVLDKLVNYAGEVSISRAQLEQQLSGLKGNLNELRGNVARFADQVRELDIQADTQIRSRVSEEKLSDAGDFDPLEMDRYSRLQQLSRSLSESVDDLVTIQSGLNRFAVQTEGVLSQQAMLNTELQDGLMSARMVPFNTLVSRLRHQARQTARELDKEIDFEVTGGELEMDRNILDQISEALEHMIRNSLDHGIESAESRKAAGKPARGAVSIDCRQEGNEVVLRFTDDGAGLDVERIKSRAVEAGLLSADSDLTDEEVIQLVVLSGFSTAPAVTQLSGRGVGLDVVNDAVRRLGGTLSMENRPGEGVTFDMRLPLSLSITQAMFVRCGDQQFAIPLGVIETVMKSDPSNLSEFSKDGDPVFKQDERQYTLMDLTATLGLEPASTASRIPVLLVRMGAREVAVRVDEFIGTDEIVVKQLGDHLGRLSGINGATVAGDGSVVLILDIAELWLAQERLPAFRREAPEDTDTPPRVMVVDDSLTVRKVTGRNLGRHGMEVTMARDGLDALDQLTKGKPDVMLVDIEMPRMDGYELTSRIREDVNLRDIPIIVITSRAGSKHREKAMELGANAYLTKPYQERELLDEVNALLDAAPPKTVH